MVIPFATLVSFHAVSLLSKLKAGRRGRKGRGEEVVTP